MSSYQLTSISSGSLAWDKTADDNPLHLLSFPESTSLNTGGLHMPLARVKGEHVLQHCHNVLLEAGGYTAWNLALWNTYNNKKLLKHTVKRVQTIFISTNSFNTASQETASLSCSCWLCSVRSPLHQKLCNLVTKLKKFKQSWVNSEKNLT